MTETTVIGFGNPMRGDDGVGPAVVAALCEHGIDAVAFDGDGTELIEAWQDRETVILVDAMVSGAVPGTMRRFDIADTRLPQDLFRSSSHQFGLAQAVEMGRLLGRLPPRMILFGVEGKRFDFGTGLTPSVTRAVQSLVRRIHAELAGDE